MLCLIASRSRVTVCSESQEWFGFWFGFWSRFRFWFRFRFRFRFRF